jgi:hypothetical protein
MRYYDAFNVRSIVVMILFIVFVTVFVGITIFMLTFVPFWVFVTLFVAVPVTSAISYVRMKCQKGAKE